MPTTTKTVAVQCRLCGSTKNKRGQSHILPAAFYREIKRRGGGLLLISRDGLRREKPSKDGPKDHKILCLKCESATSAIDDYGSKVFIGYNFILFKIYSKKQKLAGYTDNIDGLKLKRFLIFTILKAAWSQDEMYNNFNITPDLESLFIKCIHSNEIDSSRIHCFLMRRQSTIKGFHSTPEIHNGWVNGARHNFGTIAGHLFHIHILEYTPLVFVSDSPSDISKDRYFIHDSGRIWVIRNQVVNQKLDNIALEFMRERLATEKRPNTV